MPQSLIPNKLKLIGSMKTYKALRTNTKKRCPFHHRGLKCKYRKSRDTWGDRQVWPWSTKWSRAKKTEFCQENNLVIANTLLQQPKRQLYTWTSAGGRYQKSDGLYSWQPNMEKFYTVSKNKTWSWMWLISWTPCCKTQTYFEESRGNH